MYIYNKVLEAATLKSHIDSHQVGSSRALYTKDRDLSFILSALGGQ